MRKSKKLGALVDLSKEWKRKGSSHLTHLLLMTVLWMLMSMEKVLVTFLKQPEVAQTITGEDHTMTSILDIQDMRIPHGIILSNRDGMNTMILKIQGEALIKINTETSIILESQNDTEVMGCQMSEEVIEENEMMQNPLEPRNMRVEDDLVFLNIRIINHLILFLILQMTFL